MLVDRKPFIWVWRPFYRRIYSPLAERVLHRMTSRLDRQWAAEEQVLLTMLASQTASRETLEQVRLLAERLRELEENTRRLSERIAALESAHASR